MGAPEPPAALTLDRVSVESESVSGRGRTRDVRRFRVVDGVSLRIAAGESVGVVGGPDSGAPTLLRVAGGVTLPTTGRVTRGEGADGPVSVQAVLREAEAGIGARTTVEEQVGWIASRLPSSVRVERRARTLDALTTVGLAPEDVDRVVRSLPLIDQRRVLLARAAAAGPDVLVLEDLTRGLGPIERGQMLDAVVALRRSFVPTVLLRDPDLAFVTVLADRLVVLHHARLVESGPANQVARAAAHPYTRAVFDALPVPRAGVVARDRARPTATLPTVDPPSGCRFHPSCWRADERCRSERPPLEAAPAGDADHVVACFHPVP